MGMRTVAYREFEDTTTLIEASAAMEGIKPSEFRRRAVAEYVTQAAIRYPVIADLIQEMQQERMAAVEIDISHMLRRPGE